MADTDEAAASLRATAEALRHPDAPLQRFAQDAQSRFRSDVAMDASRSMLAGMSDRGPIEPVVRPAPDGVVMFARNAGELAVLSSGRRSGRHGRTSGRGTSDRISTDVDAAVDRLVTDIETLAGETYDR